MKKNHKKKIKLLKKIYNIQKLKFATFWNSELNFKKNSLLPIYKKKLFETN